MHYVHVVFMQVHSGMAETRESHVAPQPGLFKHGVRAKQMFNSGHTACDTYRHLLPLQVFRCLHFIRGSAVMGCRYIAARQPTLEAQRAETMAACMEQRRLYPCNSLPYMPLLVSAVVHKVCTGTHDNFIVHPADLVSAPKDKSCS